MILAWDFPLYMHVLNYRNKMQLIGFKIKINSWTNYTDRFFASYSILSQKIKFVSRLLGSISLHDILVLHIRNMHNSYAFSLLSVIIAFKFCKVYLAFKPHTFMILIQPEITETCISR